MRTTDSIGSTPSRGDASWRTTNSPTESLPLSEAFEKKTGIKVNLWRAVSGSVVQRVISEARARRHGLPSSTRDTTAPNTAPIA